MMAVYPAVGKAKMGSKCGLGRELSGIELSRLQEEDAVEIEDQMTWEWCRFARSIWLWYRGAFGALHMNGPTRYTTTVSIPRRKDGVCCGSSRSD
jgi:hypothetical protein